MPQLINSPRYYELYDFYKKSVLSCARRTVSSFHQYDFNVVTDKSDWRESYRSHAILRESMIRAIRACINNTPYDFYHTEQNLIHPSMDLPQNSREIIRYLKNTIVCPIERYFYIGTKHVQDTLHLYFEYV